jgi:hypothetical protein
LVRWTAALTISVLVLASCAHPGFRFIVRNDDARVAFVRFSFEGNYADFVYEAPPGSFGSGRQGTEEWRGSVDFLAADCTVVTTLAAKALGDVLVHLRSDGDAATSTFTPETEIPPLKVTEECVRR